jgi:hypothetical protein
MTPRTTSAGIKSQYGSLIIRANKPIISSPLPRVAIIVSPNKKALYIAV